MEKYQFSGHTAHRYAQDFVAGDDGFYYYWPDNGGCISAYELRQIAELLDWINAPQWDVIIRDFSA